MRGITSILITILIAAILLAVYMFTARPRLNAQIEELEVSAQQKQADIDDIRKMSAAIGGMQERLPQWKNRLDLFRSAIPSDIEDNIFFANLTDELDSRGLELISLDATRPGKWLGNLTEAQKTELQEAGIDVVTAQKLEVAFWNVTVNGEYGEIIEAFEALKTTNRLFSIEEVSAPAGQGGGVIQLNDQPDRTPLAITGKLFYNLPQNYLEAEALYYQVMQTLVGESAQEISGSMRTDARRLLEGDLAPSTRRSMPDSESDSETPGDGEMQPAEAAGGSS